MSYPKLQWQKVDRDRTLRKLAHTMGKSTVCTVSADSIHTKVVPHDPQYQPFDVVLMLENGREVHEALTAAGLQILAMSLADNTITVGRIW